MSKHASLRGILSKQLSFLCFIYLRNNNTELVNRLIQIFLQFNMMRQVEMLVKILFDFECEFDMVKGALTVLKMGSIVSDVGNVKLSNIDKGGGGEESV